MTPLRHRWLRIAWMWCLLYTSFVPEPVGARRRVEVLGHLWESQRAGLRPRSVAGACARGALQDVRWSLRRGGRRTAAAPATWVAVAAALPVTALVVSSVADDGTAGRVEAVALYGSLSLLAVSGLLAVRRRG